MSNSGFLIYNLREIQNWPFNPQSSSVKISRINLLEKQVNKLENELITTSKYYTEKDKNSNEKQVKLTIFFL